MSVRLALAEDVSLRQAPVAVDEQIGSVCSFGKLTNERLDRRSV